MAELNGREAQQFTIKISERQFQIIWNKPEGDMLMAESSSMSTMLKSFEQMMRLSGKPGCVFELREES